MDEKIIYNKFQLAQMEQQKGGNKLAFLRQLLTTGNVCKDKTLFSIIKGMIRKMVTSALKFTGGLAGAVAYTPFAIVHGAARWLPFIGKEIRATDAKHEEYERKRYEKMGKPYPETLGEMLYQNTDEFEKDMSFVRQKLGTDDPRFFMPEIQKNYAIIESMCKNTFPAEEFEKIRGSIDLTQDGNFLINGKEVAIIEGNERIKEFLQHSRDYIKDHPEYVQRDCKVFESKKHDDIPYMFVDAVNPLVREFLYPDAETVRMNEEKREMNEETKQRTYEKIEEILSQHKLSRPDKVPFKKTLWNQMIDVNITDIVRTVKKEAPEMLKELAVMISVSTNKNNNHLVATDENCYYVKLPATKKETIIAIPKDTDHRFSKNKGLLVTIRMDGQYPIVDKETLNPTGKYVSCADMIIHNKFAPTDIRRIKDIGETAEIGGKQLDIVNVKGIDYGIDRTDPEHMTATIIRSVTDRFYIEIPEKISVAGSDIPVAAIADNAFYGTPVQKIILPESMKDIGNFAFDGCNDLKELYQRSGEKVEAVEITHHADKSEDKVEEQVSAMQDIHNDTSDMGLARDIKADEDRKEKEEKQETKQDISDREEVQEPEDRYVSAQSIYDLFGDMGH